MSELLREPPQNRAVQKPPAKLEVESDSSVSISVSVLYYDLSNYSQSLDTVNMLQTKENEPEAAYKDSASPKYVNTSHISTDAVAPQIEEVPHRFSQFILEDKSDGPLQSHRSNDISESMGSQATIFSTRKNESIRSSTSLKRTRAIRFKQGSLAYRMRLRLKKALKAMKSRMKKAWRLVVRAPSRKVSRKPSRAGVSRGRLGRKNRGVAGPLQISRPLENRELGERGATMVPHLTADIKAEASQPQKKMLEFVTNEKAGRESHLLRYIQEQQNSGVSAGSYTSYSANSRTPPAPPPHRNLSKVTEIIQKQQENERNRMYELWNRYLLNVVVQRIKLRQEISVFQAIVANTAIPGLLSPQNSVAHSAPKAEGRELASSLGDESCGNHESDWATTVHSESEPEDHDAKRLQKVLNRQSVLGEMLDYTSESESDVLVTLGHEMSRSYGTVRRLAASSVAEVARLPIPRLNGVQNFSSVLRFPSMVEH